MADLNDTTWRIATTRMGRAHSIATAVADLIPTEEAKDLHSTSKSLTDLVKARGRNAGTIIIKRLLEQVLALDAASPTDANLASALRIDLLAALVSVEAIVVTGSSTPIRAAKRVDLIASGVVADLGDDFP